MQGQFWVNGEFWCKAGRAYKVVAHGVRFRALVLRAVEAQSPPRTWERGKEEREVVAYVQGFEERTIENRGYCLSHDEYVEVLEEAMALYRR